MSNGGHPYVPNSAPQTRSEMLAAIGFDAVDDLYASIPARLRLEQHLDVPGPLDEHAVERHVGELLARNRPCTELVSFLGGGCWHHFVPAVCDEVVRRAEFLTAYWADAYTDHGKHQAFFEYASLLGELLEMDAVSLPTYDWGNAAAVSLRMACRLTGRREVLILGPLSPERRSIIANYLQPDIVIEEVGCDLATGNVDLVAAAGKASRRTAAVYFENPTYLGVIEASANGICELAHDHGALAVVGVDPISLGVMAPPASFGGDIVCGELQPLGIHMEFGGGLAGFIASPDSEEYVAEYPTFLIGLTPTRTPGEHGFGLVAWERTSYRRREHGKDFGGTTTGLWAIAAAVYLAAMGPAGLRELGSGILQRSHYAAALLEGIDGIACPRLSAPFFKEFVVNLDASGYTVAELNRALLERGIVGGRDLSDHLSEVGESMLVCVTEMHTKADLDRLAGAIEEIVGR